MSAHVLVADDDPVVRDVVRRYLERDGFRVTQAADGGHALSLVAGSDPVDLLILDVMMPEVDGIEVCRRLRPALTANTGAEQVPIILLTALGEEDDRVLGLQVGADDYVTKPFSPRELALRVATVLRRAAPEAAEDPGSVRVVADGALAVDTAAHRVCIGPLEMALTAREFDLLHFLMTHPDEVFSREQLLEQVWGWNFGDLSTVTVHVKRLRAKLAGRADPNPADPVETVWGRGYRWRSGTFPC